MCFVAFLRNMRLYKLILLLCLHNFHEMIPFEEKSLFMLLIPQFIY